MTLLDKVSLVFRFIGFGTVHVGTVLDTWSLSSSLEVREQTPATWRR